MNTQDLAVSVHRLTKRYGHTEVLKNVNDKVKAGEPIIKVDRAFMEKENIPLITPVIVINPLDKQIVSYHVGEQVKVKDSDILELA